MSSTTKKRYLTKSLFMMATECPTKMYYYRKDEYPSRKDGNEFLQALADGGFQVGALAQCYHPGGEPVETLDVEEAVKMTSELMKKDEVTIFEAAVRFEDFLIRVDVLKKTRNHLDLIEVKSKSYHPEKSLRTKKGGIVSGWRRYIFDVAFQTVVAEKAFPAYTVTPYLMLSDKSQKTSVEGLNQKFKLIRKNGRTEIVLSGKVTREALGNPILSKLEVREYVDEVLAADYFDAAGNPVDFLTWMDELAAYRRDDERFPVNIKSECGKCEFRVPKSELEPGQKSGFEECWKLKLGWKEEDFLKPLVFDLWYLNAEKCLERGIYHLKDLSVDDHLKKKTKSGELKYKGRGKRQHLQIKKTCLEKNPTEWVDPGLFSEMKKWKYPLNFIDFETCTPVIPFSRGRTPYEEIAFQFSCHTVHENGRTEHREWISKHIGVFPNFKFVAELKDVLEKNEGSIFRYADHENTVLRHIHSQLTKSISENDRLIPDDAGELVKWIDTVTTRKEFVEVNGKLKETPVPGDRTMIDMRRVVEKYFYHPKMGGSNSIKQVLPAILHGSAFLRQKYSKPYESKNFTDWVWWKLDPKTGGPLDPYKLLPPLFEEEDLDRDARIFNQRHLDDGGAAMLAYARMQFTEMTDEERKSVIAGLLRYCELDTLAMVMIFEHWHNLMEGV